MKPPVKRLPSLMALALALLLALGCSVGASQPPTPRPTSTVPPEPPRSVVVTTTLLGDLARNVGGERVRVTVLVPPGADVHSFQSVPSDSVAVAGAALIVSNGAGLDDFLQPVLASAQPPEAVVVVASEGLEAQPLEELEFPDDDHEAEDHHEAEEDHEHEAEEGGHHHEHGGGDPHFWLDPRLTVHYVERIRDGLVLADPDHAAGYRARAEEYSRSLRELDREIAAILEPVPPQRRRLVTFHDAYGYFARRYGWRVSAFVPSDASQVTPGAIVSILEGVKEEGIPAVFKEPQFSGEVLSQAARDAGVAVGTLRALPDREYSTYLEMMRANARTLAELLR